MKKNKTLVLALCIGFLLITVSAIEEGGCLGCEGKCINVTNNNQTDHEECIAAGYPAGALFHACFYDDCFVPNPCPENETIPGPGISCCIINTATDYSGHACCSTETTTTTIKKTTTTVKSGGGGCGGCGGTVIGYLAEKKPTCYDKIKNCHEDGECEEDVDCGGPCDPCPTCTDGIQNQGEEAVDCGGPCKACPTTSTIAPTTTTTSTTSTTIETTTPATTIKETTTTTDTGPTGALIGLMPEGALLGLFLLLLLLLFLMTKRKKKEEGTAAE